MENAAEKTKSVLVAMSGGVDSSVACLLLQEAGLACRGVTMQLFDTEAAGPAAVAKNATDATDAASIADKLGIPHERVSLATTFRKEVIDPFIAAYRAGITPNPCVLCNRAVKFGALLELAEERGCDYLATGHYARVSYDDARGRWLLRKGPDPKKDQSYVLYQLTQEQLAKVKFPLGEMDKEETRRIAGEHGFVNAQKGESQDICFIPDGDFADFIIRTTGEDLEPGDYLDTEGNVLGTHRGALRYTKGQRKGLRLAVGTPVYVLSKDMEANTVTVGPEAPLFEREAWITDCNWISVPEITEPMRVLAMSRYHKKEAAATLYPPTWEEGASNEHGECGDSNGRFRVVFDEPQRAMTCGQSLVCYDPEEPDIVVGGGIICATAK